MDLHISTFRTEHGAEVDFIIEVAGVLYALEVKASKVIGTGDLGGFKRFTDYAGRKHRKMILYMGDTRKKFNSVDVFPWQEGLNEMGL